MAAPTTRRSGEHWPRAVSTSWLGHGHSHERIVEQESQTPRVNAGQVMGRFGLSTHSLYDTSTGQAEIVEVAD